METETTVIILLCISMILNCVVLFFVVPRKDGAKAVLLGLETIRTLNYTTGVAIDVIRKNTDNVLRAINSLVQVDTKLVDKLNDVLITKPMIKVPLTPATKVKGKRGRPKKATSNSVSSGKSKRKHTKRSPKWEKGWSRLKKQPNA